MKAILRCCMHALMLSLALAAQAGMAEDYPSRPITAIWPYPPGGTGETAFRVILQECSRLLGQSIVIDNRGGAGGRVGFDAMMRGPKDGYLIGMLNSPVTINQPLMEPSLMVTPGKNYQPIVLTHDVDFVVVVQPALPVRSMQALLDYAKANPGKLNYGSNGQGTGGHLGMEMLKLQYGVDLTHVAYKGEAPAITGFLGAQTDVYFASGIMKPHIDSGKAIALATTGRGRWNLFPNLPTLKEALGSELVATTWTGIGGPAGMPDEAVAKVNHTVNQALAAPEVRKRLDDLGMVPMGGSTEAMNELIRSDLERWGKVIRAANIKLN